MNALFSAQYGPAAGGITGGGGGHANLGGRGNAPYGAPYGVPGNNNVSAGLIFSLIQDPCHPRYTIPAIGPNYSVLDISIYYNIKDLYTYFPGIHEHRLLTAIRAEG